MFNVILVATDGSDGGDRAMSFARDLAVEQGAQLRVVHVEEMGSQDGALLQKARKAIYTKIKDQISRLQADGLDAQFELLQMTLTSPAHAIADAASDVADLIVLGNVGSGPLKGLLLGSVAYRMLQIAPCPVLVVPNKER
jgi:nucleotide-binding universal stress UspA family protein